MSPRARRLALVLGGTSANVLGRARLLEALARVRCAVPDVLLVIGERLDAAGIANARLNTAQEFWDHPQLEARDRWSAVGTSAGPIEAMKPPFNLDEAALRIAELRGVDVQVIATAMVKRLTIT